MPKPTISIRFETDVRYTPSDRRLIRIAALRHPDVEKYDELVVHRQLDEGLSSARVYEAEWVNAGGGNSDWSVIKLDSADRLAREGRLCERFPHATSFMKVIATTCEDRSRAGEPACLLYAHAGSLYPGGIESLATVVRQAIAHGGANEERARERLSEALAIVRKQLHKGEADRPGSGARHFDFYLRRWLPTAVVRCQHVDFLGERQALRLFLMDQRPEGEIEPGRDELSDVAWIGRTAAFEGEEVVVTDSAVFVNVPDNACFHIEGVSPHEITAKLDGVQPSYVQIEGEISQVRRNAYAQVLQQLGFDPNADHLAVDGLRFINPLLGLQERALSWARREPRPTFSFGHGDLHPGNVLCVGNHLAIIDHALAGEGYPSWSDAARLIGATWRNAIASALDQGEIARVIDAAFRQSMAPAVTKLAVAARLLAAAVSDALLHGPKSDAAERELWIDLHHFAWIGLKWPGETSRRLAMVLLAAVAIEKVQALDQAVAIRKQLGQLTPDPGNLGQFVAQAPALLAALDNAAGALDPSQQLRWSFREELLKLAEQQLAELGATDAEDGGLLGRLLDKAITGAWRATDSRDAARLRLPGTGGLEARDRVVLVDILFFACILGWQDDAYDLLLDLAGDGAPEVQAEVALVLSWLLGEEPTWRRLDSRPELKTRTQGALSRRQLVDQMMQANSARLQSWDYYLLLSKNLIHFIEVTPPRISWLRRFDPLRDLAEREREETPRSLIDLLVSSISLYEAEKGALIRAFTRLSKENQQLLLVILREERRLLNPFPVIFQRFNGRLLSISSFINHILSPAQHEELSDRLRRFDRSFAELVGDYSLRMLVVARENVAAIKALEGRLRSLEGQQLAQTVLARLRLKPTRGSWHRLLSWQTSTISFVAT